jgi:hypothetical protein
VTIGIVDRFAGPDQLVAYLGLNPSVHQSGEGPAHRGRMSSASVAIGTMLRSPPCQTAITGLSDRPRTLSQH